MSGNNYALRSVSSGQYLDGRDPGMSEPLLSNGTRDPHTDKYLQFTISSVGCSLHSIRSVSSGQFLDGRDKGMSDPLLNGTQNATTNKYLQWRITPAGHHHFSIRSHSSEQYLDGRDAGLENPLLSSGSRDPKTDPYLQWILVPLHFC